MLEKTAQVNSPLKPPGGFVYQRHKPEETELYKIIEQNLPSFRSHLSNADISLPGFVHEEFRKYLRCGLLKHGFLRVKCGGCRFEHLVAFSCKLRGFCPSCGARRMIETSAHLVDHVMPVMPVMPVRQWVLSFPWPLRLLFARQPNTLSRCLAVIIRAIETDLIHRAGLTRESGARTGIVTLIQRFGSALNLNPDAAQFTYI
jgi:ribosomal protein S27E